MIRSLYRAFDRTPLPGELPLRDAVSGATPLTLGTLGAAGGQRLVGAFTTGPHGGDVARRPIADDVHALVLVGSGGVVRRLQRDALPGRAPIVDFARPARQLRNQLPPSVPVTDNTGAEGTKDCTATPSPSTSHDWCSATHCSPIRPRT